MALPTSVVSLGIAILELLRPSLEARLHRRATPVDIALWHVRSVDDLAALYLGGRAAEGLSSTRRLMPWAAVAQDTLAPNDAIWVELVGWLRVCRADGAMWITSLRAVVRCR